MRLDKYLKVSRIIKRRTIANEACDAGRVEVNGKVARASYDVKVGDVINISFGARDLWGVLFWMKTILLRILLLKAENILKFPE